MEQEIPATYFVLTSPSSSLLTLAPNSVAGGFRCCHLLTCELRSCYVRVCSNSIWGAYWFAERLPRSTNHKQRPHALLLICWKVTPVFFGRSWQIGYCCCSPVPSVLIGTFWNSFDCMILVTQNDAFFRAESMVERLEDPSTGYQNMQLQCHREKALQQSAVWWPGQPK